MSSLKNLTKEEIEKTLPGPDSIDIKQAVNNIQYFLENASKKGAFTISEAYTLHVSRTVLQDFLRGAGVYKNDSK